VGRGQRTLFLVVPSALLISSWLGFLPLMNFARFLTAPALFLKDVLVAVLNYSLCSGSGATTVTNSSLPRLMNAEFTHRSFLQLSGGKWAFQVEFPPYFLSFVGLCFCHSFLGTVMFIRPHLEHQWSSSYETHENSAIGNHPVFELPIAARTYWYSCRVNFWVADDTSIVL